MRALKTLALTQQLKYWTCPLTPHVSPPAQSTFLPPLCRPLLVLHHLLQLLITFLHHPSPLQHLNSSCSVFLCDISVLLTTDNFYFRLSNCWSKSPHSPSQPLSLISPSPSQPFCIATWTTASKSSFLKCCVEKRTLSKTCHRIICLFNRYCMSTTPHSLARQLPPTQLLPLPTSPSYQILFPLKPLVPLGHLPWLEQHLSNSWQVISWLVRRWQMCYFSACDIDFDVLYFPAGCWWARYPRGGPSG